MTYSANDHAGDTMDLVVEVIDEAIEQTETQEAAERLGQMRSEALDIKSVIIENEGETPTQALLDALDGRECDD